MMTRRTQMTLAYAFIGGMLAGSFAGWLMVPAVLPVEYLTITVLFVPLVSVVAAAVFVRSRPLSRG